MRVGMRLLALGPALSLAACVGTIESSDSVPATAALARRLAPAAPAPAWETVFRNDVADLVEFVNDSRVLIGAVEIGATLGVPRHSTVALWDAARGERIWESARPAVRDGRYSVVAIQPRIVLLGMGPETLQLMALEPDTGRAAWTAEIKSPRAHALSDEGNRLFVLAGAPKRRTLHAMDLATGRTAWTYRVPAGARGGETNALLGVQRDGVYVVEGQTLVRLSAGEGSTAWSVQRQEIEGAGSTMHLYDDGVLVWSKSRVAFLSADDGRLLWHRALRTGSFMAVSRHENRVVQVVTPDPLTLDEHSDVVQALDARSGEPLWSRTLGGTVVGHAFAGDSAAFSLEDEVVRLDMATGAIRFRTTLPALFRLASPLEYDPPGQADVLHFRGDALLLARESAGIAAFGAQDGRERWRHSNYVAAVTAYPYSTPSRILRLNASLPAAKPQPNAPTVAQAAAPRPSFMLHRYQVEYGRLESARRSAASRGDRAETSRIRAAQTSNLQRQIGALQAQHAMERTQANLALASAVADSASNLNRAIEHDVRQGIISRLTMEIDHTPALHLGAFKGRYYIRPFQIAAADGMLGFTVVDLDTGLRADLVTSPYAEIVTRAGIEVPQAALDASASRLITVAIGLRPERYEPYVARTVKQPRPSVMAYELSHLRFQRQNDALEKRLGSFRPGPAEIQFVAAAQTGNIAKVKRMLASGMNIDSRNPQGMTALMAAAARDKTDMVQVLLKTGARADLVANGRTALHLASDPGVKKLLEDAGARKQ